MDINLSLVFRGTDKAASPNPRSGCANPKDGYGCVGVTLTLTSVGGGTARHLEIFVAWIRMRHPTPVRWEEEPTLRNFRRTDTDALVQP